MKEPQSSGHGGEKEWLLETPKQKKTSAGRHVNFQMTILEFIQWIKVLFYFIRHS